MTGEEEVERTEVEAVLEARRELGPSYDRALVDSFADRVERAVDQRVEARLQRRGDDDRTREGGRIRQFVLGIISVGVGVPITIVPTVAAPEGTSGLPATVVAWLGIVAVNAAHAAAVNGPRRRSHDG
ncbi:hypothetical protein [Nocardioides sp. GXQ0305]|uniref:hypothetical protein n=1 Tax=Nocardioides sp. GXQ0305 TaxID=3423912 RepID=UPI003D7D86E4